MAHHFLSVMRFKDGAPADTGSVIAEAARRLLTAAESVAVGPVTAVRNTEEHYDLVIDVTFADEEAFRAGRETPEAREFSESYLRPNLDAVLHINYDAD